MSQRRTHYILVQIQDFIYFSSFIGHCSSISALAEERVVPSVILVLNICSSFVPLIYFLCPLLSFHPSFPFSPFIYLLFLCPLFHFPFHRLDFYFICYFIVFPLHLSFVVFFPLFFNSSFLSPFSLLTSFNSLLVFFPLCAPPPLLSC